MLRFVLGKDAATRTEYLRKLFCAKAEAGDETLVFIVPDQISFETETAFLDRLGASRAGRIRVFGFSRLCDYVFEKTGHKSLSFADEGVRHVVMSLALDEVKDELEIFSKKAADFDLCELMLSTLKEFKKCAVTSSLLCDAAENCGDETLSKKLFESALILDAYDAVMKKSYLDPLDSLTRVSSIIESERLFSGCTVAVDGFYGFTSQEFGVLEILMDQSGEMLVSLADDFSDGSDTDVFFAARRTKNRLSRAARSRGVSIAPSIDLYEPHREKSRAIAALCENLYRYHKEVFDEEAQDVCCYRASDIYEECDFVARNIKKLIEGGMRYKDIAVIARAVEPYAGVLDYAFEKYDISYFMDAPFNINATPLIRLVSAAFSAIHTGFDRDEVLTLLKTGLTDFSVLEIAEFENYLFTWDITKSGLKREFSANPSGFSQTFSDEEAARLGRIEALRDEIITKLTVLQKSCLDTDGRSIAKALMRFLYALHVDKNIGALCERYEENGEEALAGDLVRIWNELCAILDKMVYVLGDYRIDSVRFFELLRAHLSASEIAVIPRGADQVDVAVADRALLFDKKAVFIIGVIDGEFPRTPVEAGVFTDTERVFLKSNFLPLSDSIEELTTIEKYYLYTAIGSASEKLFLSSYAAALNGETLSPSTLFFEALTILPRLRHEEFDVKRVGERLYSKKAAFEYLVEHFSAQSPVTAALKEYFTADEEYGDIVFAIEEAGRDRVRRIRDKSLTKKLFKNTMNLSASRIESYYRCPFEYFIKYALKIKPREKATVDALEYGTLMHHILENFFSSHRGDDFSAIKEDEVKAEVEALMKDYAERHFGGLENKTARFQYLYHRILFSASALVVRILAELSQSEFVPADFELSIGDEIPAYTIKASDDLTVTLTGSVDRVDVMEKNGEKYIRIIDYKTGAKQFKLSDILYGINLQMFIYMAAITGAPDKKYGSMITPAGVLYMPAVSPTVAANYGDSEEKIKAEKEKQYTMKGALLLNGEVIKAMEKEGKGVFVPVAVKGESLKPSKDGALVSLEAFGALFQKVDELIAEMANALSRGEVDDIPVVGRYDECKYCRYHAICNHQDEDKTRAVDAFSTDEVLYELLRKDGEEDEIVD